MVHAEQKFDRIVVIYVTGFSGNPSGDIIKRILGGNEVKTHWSGPTAGSHWFTVTAAFVTLPGDSAWRPWCPGFMVCNRRGWE